MNCKVCGAQLDANGSFCPQCGTPVPKEVIEQMSAKVNETAENAVESVECVAEDAVESVENEAEKAVESVEEAVSQVNDAVPQPEENAVFGQIPPMQEMPFNNVPPIPDVQREIPSQGGKTQVNTKLLLMILIPIVAVIIAAVVILCVFVLGGGGSDSASEAVQKYYNALGHSDSEEIIECAPSDFCKEVLSEYGMSEKELNQALNEYFEDWSSRSNDGVEFDLSDVAKVDVRIKKAKACTNKETRNLRDSIEKNYDFSDGGFNPELITAAAKMNVVVTYVDKYGEKLTKNEYESVIAVKYDDSWYDVNSMKLINNVADDF